MLLLAVIAVVVASRFLVVRVCYHRRVRRAPAWDCGFGRLDPRMQDTAEGFGQPIRHIFVRSSPWSGNCPRRSIRRHATASRSATVSGARVPADRRLLQRIADSVAWLQQGRISTYLMYSFITLVLLLAVVL